MTGPTAAGGGKSMPMLLPQDAEAGNRACNMAMADVSRRVILLGASNLTRAISTVVGIAQSSLGGPLDIVAALGHGRSYGMWSRVLVRELPGITTCALWEELDRRPRLDTVALVTDIGNDIFYGASIDEIVSWVDASLARLERTGARTIMTLLPVGKRQRDFGMALPADAADDVPQLQTRTVRRSGDDRRTQ